MKTVLGTLFLSLVFPMLSFAQAPGLCKMTLDPITKRGEILKNEIYQKFGWNFNFIADNGTPLGRQQAWLLDAVSNKKGYQTPENLLFLKTFMESLSSSEYSKSKFDPRQVRRANRTLARSLSNYEITSIMITQMIGRLEGSINGDVEPHVRFTKGEGILGRRKIVSTYTQDQINSKTNLLKALGFSEGDISKLFTDVVLGDRILMDKTFDFVLESNALRFAKLVQKIRNIKEELEPVSKKELKEAKSELDSLEKKLSLTEPQEKRIEELRNRVVRAKGPTIRAQYEMTREELISLVQEFKRLTETEKSKLNEQELALYEEYRASVDRSNHQTRLVEEALENHQIRPDKDSLLLSDKDIPEVFDAVTRHPVARLLKLLKYDWKGVKGMCFGRALNATAELELRKVNPDAVRKVWVSGVMKSKPLPFRLPKWMPNLGKLTGLAGKEVSMITWQFHVATMVQTKEGTWWVLDPSHKEPQPFDVWMHHLEQMDAIGNMWVNITARDRFGGKGDMRYKMEEIMDVPEIDAITGKIIGPGKSELNSWLIDEWYNNYFVDLARSYSQRTYAYWKAIESAQSKPENAGKSLEEVVDIEKIDVPGHEYTFGQRILNLALKKLGINHL